MQVDFSAPEYQADGTFQTTPYRFQEAAEGGWQILRDGKNHLTLGPGYRLLRTLSCGICSTDLARRFLPFPLPQIIGHEVVVVDESGQRYVVEINASHQARGVESDCPFCATGLHTHCPERITLGIDRLPGGCGPYILAPVNAVIPVPNVIPSRSAVLAEPLAAALHAVTTIAPRANDHIAVLGAGRLGLLVVAALHAWRNDNNVNIEIVAISRHPERLALAVSFGADTLVTVNESGHDLPAQLADVVIDASGSPAGFDLALRLARREVHLKSTHGQPAAGLKHLTELVVDELNLYPLADRDISGSLAAWLADGTAPEALDAGAWLQGSPAEILQALERRSTAEGLPRADFAVVDGLEGIDLAIRPVAEREVSLVRPRGGILLKNNHGGGSPLTAAVLDRGLQLTSSRCGDLREAVALMSRDDVLLGLGDRLITDTFPPSRIADAFARAADTTCLKAVIEHEEAP